MARNLDEFVKELSPLRMYFGCEWEAMISYWNRWSSFSSPVSGFHFSVDVVQYWDDGLFLSVRVPDMLFLVVPK